LPGSSVRIQNVIKRNSLNLLIPQLEILHSADSIPHTHSRVGVLVHDPTSIYMWRPELPRAVNRPLTGEAAASCCARNIG
jgi:hypothetical protein